MIKIFCDKCGIEITDKNHWSQIQDLQITSNIVIISELKRTTTINHCCVNCIIDAVKYLDKRPIQG
jgi:hypothetical protein